MKFNFKSIVSLFLAAATLLLCSCSSSGAGTATENSTGEDVSEPAVTTKKKITYPKTIDYNDIETLTEIFDVSDVVEGITTTVNEKTKSIIQTGTVNGTEFKFTIGLSKWAGNTTPEQMTVCSKLFWYCYPQMYARLANGGSPTSVTLTIDNEDYEVASTSGNVVHIHDMWLYNNKTDYDCLTHEFAHVVQGGWHGGYCPEYRGDTYMIERFADYCRYIYAYDTGLYNDTVWELQTARNEDTYYKSVRFWVWIDYTYSTENADIMKRINNYVYDADISATSKNWGTSGKMWSKVFEGTAAKGKNINELWDLFVASDFSTLPSQRGKGKLPSRLESSFSVRETVKGRTPDAGSYIKL